MLAKRFFALQHLPSLLAFDGDILTCEMSSLRLDAGLLTLLLLAAAPAPAGAQEDFTLREATSPRAAGMAGAARAFASSSEALLVNPAGIAATSRFNLDANAIFAPETSGRLLSATVIDSKLNAEESVPLGGGVGYWNYASGSGAARRSGSVAVLGLAVPLWPDVLFVGGNARYLNLTGAVRTNALTGDLGVIARFASLFSLAAVGYNLIDIHSAEAPRAWGFGAALGRDPDFHIDVDVRIDQDAQGAWKPAIAAGAEYLVAGIFQPRVGYLDDQLRGTRALSAGASIRYGGFALDGFYLKTLERTGWTLGFSLRMLDTPL